MTSDSQVFALELRFVHYMFFSSNLMGDKSVWDLIETHLIPGRGDSFDFIGAIVALVLPLAVSAIPLDSSSLGVPHAIKNATIGLAEMFLTTVGIAIIVLWFVAIQKKAAGIPDFIRVPIS